MKIQRDTETEIDKREDEEMERIIAKEIREAVREMKNNKALGPGGISVEFIKHASEIVYISEIGIKREKRDTNRIENWIFNTNL
jgi:hypothetical protein